MTSAEPLYRKMIMVLEKHMGDVGDTDRIESNGVMSQERGSHREG